MEAYLRVFVNFEQNDWTRLFPIAEFAYNNVKNASTGYTPFELKCSHHPYVFYKENVNPLSQSKLVDDLANDLKELIIICQKNLQHAQNFRSKPTIKAQSLKTMPPATKFGWTVNISKPNGIGSWKLSSLDRSKSYTWGGSQLISSSYWEVENLWRFPHVTAGAGHHQKGAGGWDNTAGIRDWQWRGVWGRKNLRQCNLCKRVRRLSTRTILSDIL